MSNIRSNLFKKELSLEEAKDDQKKISGMINELKKKLDPNKKGHPLKTDKRERVEEFIENVEQIYKIRKDIINAFEKIT